MAGLPWEMDWTDETPPPQTTPTGMEVGTAPWNMEWSETLPPAKATAADLFGRGMTGGASDYVGAAGVYLGDRLAKLFGGNFDPVSFNDALKAVRSGSNDYVAHNPITGYGMEALGGITSPLFGATAKGIGTATSALPRYASYAAQGGGIGALTGLTGAQGQGGGLPTARDIGMSALKGAGIGTATGAALPAVFEGAGWLANKVAPNWLANLSTGGDEFFGRAQAMAKALQRDQMTPDMAQAALSRLGPQATLADIGPNMTGLGEAVVSQPGEALTEGTNTLGERTQGMGQRLIRNVVDKLGSGDYYGSMDALSEAQREQASPLFQEAFAANKSVSSPVIDRLLKTPAGQDAMDYAVTRMQNKMARMAVPDPELTQQYNDLVTAGKMDPGQGPVASGLKMQTLDLIRQGFGDQERALVKQVANGTAKAGELKDVGDLRRALTSEMNRLDVTAQAGPNSLKPEGGAYARALQAYAEPARLKEALDTGMEMLGNDPELNARTVADMTPAERQAARVGLVKGLQDQIQKGRDGANIAMRVFGSPEQRAAVRPLFNTDADFNSVMDAASAESKMAQNSQRILQNSRTQPRQAAVRDLANGSPLSQPLKAALISLFHGNVREAGTQALAGLAGHSESNIPPALADSIGKTIFSQNPQEQQAALDLIRNLPALRQARVNQFIVGKAGQLPGQFGGALSPFMTGPSNQRP